MGKDLLGVDGVIIRRFGRLMRAVGFWAVRWEIQLPLEPEVSGRYDCYQVFFILAFADVVVFFWYIEFLVVQFTAEQLEFYFFCFPGDGLWFGEKLWKE